MLDNLYVNRMLPGGEIAVNGPHGLYDDMADLRMVGQDDVIMLVFLLAVAALGVVASHGITSYFTAFGPLVLMLNRNYI